VNASVALHRVFGRGQLKRTKCGYKMWVQLRRRGTSKEKLDKMVLSRNRPAKGIGEEPQ